MTNDITPSPAFLSSFHTALRRTFFWEHWDDVQITALSESHERGVRRREDLIDNGPAEFQVRVSLLRDEFTAEISAYGTRAVSTGRSTDDFADHLGLCAELAVRLSERATPGILPTLASLRTAARRALRRRSDTTASTNSEELVRPLRDWIERHEVIRGESKRLAYLHTALGGDHRQAGLDTFLYQSWRLVELETTPHGFDGRHDVRTITYGVVFEREAGPPHERRFHLDLTEASSFD